MKKRNIILTSVALMFVLSCSSAISAEDYSYISGLTPVQTEQLKRIDFSYKQQYDTLEKRIQNYKDKITGVKNDSEKSAEQKSLLVGAYERNIEILRKQQKQLADEADKSYKSALDETQYQQLKSKKTAQ